MSGGHYPHGLDLIWPCADRNGHIGAFITAGEGPIPETVLAFGALNDEAFSSLPSIGGGRLLVTVPKPDCYQGVAERGFFVFDWDWRQKAYVPVAVPDNEVVPNDILGDVGRLARETLLDLSFRSGVPIDLPELAPRVSRMEASQKSKAPAAKVAGWRIRMNGLYALRADLAAIAGISERLMPISARSRLLRASSSMKVCR
jgi:hypothetical protein